MEENYQQPIKEELLCFEKELETMRNKVSNVKVNIGSSEDKSKLKSAADEMSRFCSDLSEVTNSQDVEIKHLQTSILETFEWTEEARAREVRNKDPKYRRLLKNRSLDPLSQKLVSGVQSKYLYLDQQINEVNRKLDMEWRDHLQQTKGLVSKLNVTNYSQFDLFSLPDII